MRYSKDRRRGRRLSLALGTSALVYGLVAPVAAQAQCLPEPTQEGGTTLCTGTDPDGVRITTPGTTLVVAAEAVVSNGGGSPITVEVPNTVYPIDVRIDIAGQVTGGSQGGINLLTGAPGMFYGVTTQLALNLAAGATVTGNTALATAQSLGNTGGQLLVGIDNAGTLVGTSGIALRNDLATSAFGYTTSRSAFSAIVNRAGGVISGSIVGPVGSLTNDGLIDGGSGGAFAPGGAGTSYPYFIFPGDWTNTGTIRSNSAAATVESSTIGRLTNSGMIENAGQGAALAGSALVITNEAGGLISSGGTTAIAATSYLNLLNAGTVQGDVLAGPANSTIDSSLGLIDGSVVFGPGFNTLVTRYGGTAAPITGITGTITAAGGSDTQLLAVSTDTTIATPVALLGGFEFFAISTDLGVTTTLGSGFVAPGSIRLQGLGTLVNQASINTAGTAFLNDGFSSQSSLRFVNDGTIQTGSSADFAISANFGITEVVNNGTIASAGGGVSLSQSSLTNTGSIIAATTGVDSSGNSVTNSGTIRSTAGTGVVTSGNVGSPSFNSGLIEGATAGVRAGTYFTNTGTVIATDPDGVAVQLDAYGALFNEAGGIVGNGGQAVTATTFNEIVVNAGTINGDVALTGVGSAGSESQRYISQPGGVLNGNLVLGSTAVLFTDLVNTGAGQFAGINGTVTAASGATLRYRVTGDQAATLGPVGPFAGAAYELTSGSTLSLSAPGIVTEQVRLAGSGTVDLTADLVTNGATAALATVQALSETYYAGAQSALAITSRGTISISREAGVFPAAGSAVSLSSQDIFTNLGTISVTDREEFAYATGVSGGRLINAGSILLDGGIGVSNFAFGGIGGGAGVVNTGRIVQVAGGATAVGVSGGSLDNSGLIEVGGTAVTVYNRNEIINSGTIASTGGAAITGRDSSASATILNAAGGTISGTGGTAVRLYSGTFTNAGTVNGSVDLGYGFPYYLGAPERSFAGSTYVAAGGTIAGDLLFGDGTDLLLLTGDSLGVSGIIDGGGQDDLFGYAPTSSASVAIDPSSIFSFEDALVVSLGPDTVVTATASAPFAGDLFVSGNGAVVNQADIAGRLTTELDSTLAASIGTLFPSEGILASLANAGSVGGGVLARTAAFANSGTITKAPGNGPAMAVYGDTQLSFVNTGTITQERDEYSYSDPTASLSASNHLSISNDGQITGTGIEADVYAQYVGSASSLTLANSGTISSDGQRSAVRATILAADDGSAAALTFANSGTISATDAPSAVALDVFGGWQGNAATLAFANNGSINATSGAAGSTAFAVAINADGQPITMVNQAGGTIRASAGTAYAIAIFDGALDLVNAGEIIATGSNDVFAIADLSGLAGTVSNTGTITGDVFLGLGDDLIDNAGTIDGDVLLSGGDDAFVHRAGGVVTGIVDGGSGTNSYLVDASGGAATLDAAQIASFATLSQAGTGTGTYSGSFAVETIALGGGTLAVATGQTLATLGVTTVTAGGNADLAIINNGAVAGGITLADGNDTLLNYGTIGGAVVLGAGNDTYFEGLGSTVGAGVDGGAGTNLYRLQLAGDRTGMGANASFQNLAAEGSGTLTLALQQDYGSIALDGVGLNLALAGYSVGQITSTGAAINITIDGDVGALQLGSGDDVLALTASTLAGIYNGGAGADALQLTNAGPVSLTGSVAGFEAITLGSNALAVSGTFGAAGDTIAFDGGAQSLTLATGGIAEGAIAMGGGDDVLRLAGGSIAGAVAGGGGSDQLIVATTADTLFAPASVSEFELLASEGMATLTLATPALALDRMFIEGGLVIAQGASLATPLLAFGSGDNVLVLNGSFAGSLDGGAGNDALAIGGNSLATTMSFGSLANFETLSMSGGLATLAGPADLASMALSGGRFIGLAGSVLTVPGITVLQGATFGTAGIVNGNLVVNGTLDVGASIGTMTVNGNVALGASSTSLFELANAQADRLVVNGAVSIASGAKLTVGALEPVTPGYSFDLITASGGISGSFTEFTLPAGLPGFLVQQANVISLLGQFANSDSYAPGVQRNIDYLNALLVSGSADPGVIAAVPDLVAADGSPNTALIATLSPDAYAGTRDTLVEAGLVLAGTARKGAFGTLASEPGLFSFASGFAGQRKLEGDGSAPENKLRAGGVAGGLGFGSAAASASLFVGYLATSMDGPALAARSEADGYLVGLSGRFASGPLSTSATIAYLDADDDLQRIAPLGSARGSFGMSGWLADVSVGYSLPLGGAYALMPSIGLTAIRVERDAFAETGSSPFVLAVNAEEDTATFLDFGVALRPEASGSSKLLPFAGIGARHMLAGRANEAKAALSGGPATLLGTSSVRDKWIGRATAGLIAEIAPGLSLNGAISGEFGQSEEAILGSIGVSLSF